MFDIIIQRAKSLIEEEAKKSDTIWLDLVGFDDDIKAYYFKYYPYIFADVSEVFDLQNIDEHAFYQLLENKRDLNEDEKSLIIHLLTLHVIRRINMLSVLTIGEDVTFDLLKKLDKTKAWYRGQTDIHQRLIPSYYRPQKTNDKVSLSSLQSDYTRKGISAKLRGIFKGKNLDFTKVSFVQHTLSFTPLLDFSKNPYVATTFALEDKENDGALYVVDTSKAYMTRLSSEQKINQVLNDLHVEYYNNRPKIATLIRSPLFRALVDGSVSSNFYLFDVETNDRMRIQSGTFVLFNDVIFVKNHMIVSSQTKDALVGSIRMHRIKKEDKEALKQALVKKSERYTLTHLMEPYTYMKD